MLAFLAVALAAGAVLAIVGATERRTLAFTLGVPSYAAVATLKPGQTVCQEPIAIASGFDDVAFHVGTFARTGQPIEVSVLQATTRAPLGRGVLAAGYGDGARPLVAVGHVPAGGDADVCFRNAGTRRVALYGGPDVAARMSTAVLAGKPTSPASDLDLAFRVAHPRSTLALLPDMLQRAALFRGGWIGPWLYWLLLVVVLLAVPALIVRALRSTTDAEQ
ncbi:MAG: hypothetical protein JWQ48_823 [Conexibacter sp.]|nr:hypothetical protein [Conexibacter sp.]